METLYRKVAVSERLPETKKYYITNEGELYLDAYKNWQLSEFSKKAKVSKHHEEYFEEPDFWLEEIPDPTTQLKADKEEMIDMLEEMYSKYEKDGHLLNVSPSKIESLIQKHKQ